MMQDTHDVPPWRTRVPPGVPGAGWLVGLVFAFAVIVFSSWWWQGSHSATAAPASHAMSSTHN